MSVFSGQAFFIYFLIRILLRKFHNHTPGRPDDLPGQKNILKSECLDLLSVFRSLCEVHLEQQKPKMIGATGAQLPCDI
jgi:hypothetical protein